MKHETGSGSRISQTNLTADNTRAVDENDHSTMQAFLSQTQQAEVSLTINKDAGFRAKAQITNGGLLSVAVLVSSILLTTSVLVHVAIRDGKRRRW
ncbi:hypothetical protein [Oryzifoliimicrobium ureilyticus]|uniref:hypothetical protein n=1 Tax=Oryzifoliimicrobium ureilyticus TaxID=3113724 RepID=UPI0030765BE5